MLRSTKFWSIVISFLIIVIVLAAVALSINFSATSPTERFLERKLKKEGDVLGKIHFELSDPSKTPPLLKDMIELGYRLMIETPKYAPNYVGDKIQCTNCHIAGGDTTGGKNGGISLVGVGASYPRYNARFGKVIDLPERINSCFEKSMNGKSLPLDSKEMLALVTYLQWISKGVPIYAKVPWLEFHPLKTTRKGDPEKGKEVWEQYCAMCHGKDGQGGQSVPPVWGPESFNDAAGMNTADTLARFVYDNMPYDGVGLTVDESIDVAAYIIKQPRPHDDPGTIHLLNKMH